MMNVILFGGAFDPITVGHLKMAQLVVDELHSNRFLISPCYKHSFDKNMTDPYHRLRMCEIALDNQTDKRYKNIILSTSIEIYMKNELPTYHLLIKLLSMYPESHYKFSMIIGIDNANTFHKWVEYEKLQKLIPFIVVSRSGVERNNDVDWYMKPPHIFLKFPYDITTDVSSSEVRWLVSEGKSIEGKVPEGVAEYIYEKGLYK